MKTNILYIGGFELPDKNAAAHRVIGNAKVLKSIGCNVIFINSCKDKKTNLDIPFEVIEFQYPKNKREWLKYLNNIDHIKDVVEKQRKIDVIIAYNYPSIALYKLSKFCKKNNIKLVSDCTEWYSAKGRNFGSRLIKDLDTNFRMKVVNKKINGIIVISSFLKNYYHDRKTILVPPLVDKSEAKWKVNREKKNNNSINLSYVGSPEKEKDKLNLILESLYELGSNQYHFEIVGISKDEYLEMYPNHLNILNDLSAKINFNGRLTHNNSLKILAESDFSIYFRESTKMVNAGFPTKFVESTTMGVPSITTNVSDLAKYITNKENGFFVDINNKKNIKNQISEILSLSKDEINKIKNKVKKEKSFEFEEYQSDFIDFLNEM